MRQFLFDLIRYRSLIWRLARSQLALRYRQSVLGFGWAVIQPLMMTVVFTLFFHKGVGVASEGDVPYPLLTLCVLVPWQMFATGMVIGVPSLVQFAEVVRKVYVPREAFPLSALLTSLFDFIPAVVVLGLLFLAYRTPLGPMALWVFPLLLLQLTLTAGLLFFGAALCAKYRDIRHGVAHGLYVLMLASPVVYPFGPLIEKMSEVGRLLPYLYVALNPMAAYLDSYRRVLLHQQSPRLGFLLIAAVVSVALLVSGYRFFKKREMKFADVL